MANLSLTELFSSSFFNDSSPRQSLGEDFSLCENGNMVFHWADFHETCDAVRARLDEDSTLHEEFLRKEAALQRLGLIPVWIRTNKKVHQCTMLELYEKYLLNQTQVSMGIDPFGPIDISFISGTGPFKTLAIAECFNQSTYKDFVMVYLLRGKLPKRDFRVRLKSRVLMEYGASFQQASLVNLEQLTMQGLLLSLDSDFFLNQVSKESNFRILIDTQCLAQAMQKDLIQLKDHLSHYAFNLMYSSRKEDAFECKVSDANIQSSFDFLRNKKVFLFVPYEKFQCQHPQHMLDIKNFIHFSRDIVRAHFQAKLISESA